MIAKRIHREKQTSSFARLGKYVVDARGGIDPANWTRTADYILDTKKNGGKVSGVRVTNCATDDAAAATLEVLAVQALNTRSKSDKTYHLVISFPEGERPSSEQLRYIEDSCCCAIGLGEHQRISAVHIDTDNLHIHVAINKVHPVTFRNVEPYYDKQHLMQACETLEIELGLIHTNHGLGKGQNPGRANDIETHGGSDSLLRWIKDNAAPDLIEAAATLTSWDAFHGVMAKYDLEIRKQGAGFVIGMRDGRLNVKASSVARELSFRSLTERFGEFLPASEPTKAHEPGKRYSGQAREDACDNGLYQQYLKERDRIAAARQAAQTELKTARTAYAARLDDWYEEKHRTIKSSPLARVEKIVAYKELRNERLTDRFARRTIEAAQQEALEKDLPYLSWPTFLVREAEAGNAEAVKALRNRQRRQTQAAEDILTAESIEEARDIVFEKLKPRARRNGDIIYTAPDGGVVIDTKEGVSVSDLTPGAAVIALTLATERFGKSNLVVRGSEAFKSQLTRFAILQGMEIDLGESAREPGSEHMKFSAAL
jgi:hypothetical protein